MMGKIAAVSGLLFFLTGPAFAQAAPDSPADLSSKVTLGLYEESSQTAIDLNFRHQTGPLTSWIGAFLDPDRHVRGRIGGQYGWQRRGILIQPSVEAGTTGFLMETLYSEIGEDAFAIAGYSRTNLKLQNDITFDPNDSAQVGFGWKRGADRLVAYSIFDIRLHTKQQDTHLVWKHRLDPRSAVTIDAIYKSGVTDSGRSIRAVGGGLYYDRGWIGKLYYDPFANFGDQTQWRLSVGRKF